MKLILLRHAETEWNVEGRLMSRTDQPLSRVGKLHATDVDLAKDKAGLTLIASSPSERAMATAELVRRNNSLESLPIETFQELREMDFGTFEGMTHEQLRRDMGSLFLSWYSGSSKASTPPEGETWEDALDRAEKFLTTISLQNRSALVVSHGYQIRLILVAALGLPHPAAMRRFTIGNACYSVIQRNSSGFWQLTKHNVCTWREA